MTDSGDASSETAKGVKVVNLPDLPMENKRKIKQRPKRYTAQQLMATDFPEPKWAVRGIIQGVIDEKLKR